MALARSAGGRRVSLKVLFTWHARGDGAEEEPARAHTQQQPGGARSAGGQQQQHPSRFLNNGQPEQVTCDVIPPSFAIL